MQYVCVYILQKNESSQSNSDVVGMSSASVYFTHVLMGI